MNYPPYPTWWVIAQNYPLPGKAITLPGIDNTSGDSSLFQQLVPTYWFKLFSIRPDLENGIYFLFNINNGNRDLKMYNFS